MTGQARLVPKRRFKEYQNTSAWEQRKLGDHCEMYNGDRSSKYPNANDMVDDGIPFINAGDLENGSVNLKTANKITRKKYNQLGGAKLQLGDIVYCLRGTLGKNAFIDNFEEGTVASSLVAIRPKDIDGRYLYYILNSGIEYRQRIVHDEGAAQPNLSAKSVSEFELPVPSIAEQKKISTHFRNLDNLITLHQRKLEKTKALKAAYLSEMFPTEGECEPKRRFAGFTDAWERRKLGDMIFKMYGGASIAPEDYKDGGIATVPKGAVNSSGIADLSGSKYVDEAFYNKNSNASVYQNELVTSLRDLVPTAPNMGRIVKLKGSNDKYLMPQGVYRLILNTDADENFLISFSNTDKFRKIISEEKNGSTQVHIRNSEYLGIPIARPAKEEQVQIGTFFFQLDNIITLHQRKLEKLQRIKKAYLYEMFI